MKCPFLRGFQNSPLLLHHGKSFIEDWMSSFMLIAENIVSVNISLWIRCKHKPSAALLQAKNTLFDNKEQKHLLTHRKL